MKFALVGNPNSGKTTLFNALTGGTAHVGNWPGVTIDKRTGIYKKLEEKVDIIDLPGIYSMSPYTPEEVISRTYVLDEKPDCIINIIDATNLERNLYLTTQLLELDVPVVVALNMTDLTEKAGDIIDQEKLSKALGIPVVEISALKNKGIKELMSTAYLSAKKQRKGSSVLLHCSIKNLYTDVLAQCEKENILNPAFHAVKIIEADELEIAVHPEITTKTAELKKKINTGIFDGDFEGIVADARYKHISKEYIPALTRATRKNNLTKSDKIDKVLTHRIWGIPIFLGIMLLVFHLTFSEDLFLLSNLIPEGSFDIPIIGADAINSPGVMFFQAMEWFCGVIGDAIGGLMPEGTWYTSLVCDGILQGFFAVMSFVPQILMLFFFLTILEDSGYMARVAFIMDRAFRRFGLSGKAFMPLVMCFGCAVPGIMATRTLENEQERRRTIMLAPFFSCGAKLPIWAAFAGVFAGAYAGMNAELIVYSMYLLGIVVAILAAFILKKTVVKGETPPFIMELPAYHAPRARNIAARLWEKFKHFLIKAGTIIVAAAIVIWFLSTFSWSFQMVDDSGDSILGSIGKVLKWLFVPLGFGMGADGWKFVVATITGLIAKEIVVATMGVFSGMDGDEALETDAGELGGTALGAMMLGIGGTLGGISVAIPAMFAFMAFNLLSIPCLAAVGAAGGELNSKKKLWGAIAFWMLTSYIVSLIIFWGGVFFIACWWGALITLLALIGGITTFVILKSKGMLKANRNKEKEA